MTCLRTILLLCMVMGSYPAQAAADPPLIALWHNNTLVVTMTSGTPGCLWLDRTPLPQSCEVYQYRMPLPGVSGSDGYDAAYVPHSGQTLRFVSYDATRIDVIPVPPRSRISLPLMLR
jgi:hypothetical protein